MDPKIDKRKTNISKSSSEEIYAMLDEVESDLEEDTDQLVNDSDTEFVLMRIYLNVHRNHQMTMYWHQK